MSTTPHGEQNPAPQSSPQAFRALDHAHQQLLAAEVAELIAIVNAADCYEVDERAVFEGMERLVQPGHDGTPVVGEFLALEVGALLGISPGAAINRIGAALDLRHRHPALWEVTVAGGVRVWQALRVSELCAQLSAEAVAQVDQKLAEALPKRAWVGVMRSLPGWITAADPTAARDRAAAAAEARKVLVSPIENGQISFWGQVDPADGIDFDHALTAIARRLPTSEPGDFDRRRAAAVGILARQAFGQDALPTRTLVVHINADEATTGVATVERWGTLLNEELPRFLAGSKVVVRPILDIRTLAAQDAHDPSESLRFALEQRNPVDVFPYGTRPTRSCDLDHTIPYQDGDPGQTNPGNLGPLSRYTHRAKTHGGWFLEQPEPGRYRWRSPHGYQYEVTAAGTTRIHTAD